MNIQEIQDSIGKREIKFRAWAINEKIMCEVIALHIDEGMITFMHDRGTLKENTDTWNIDGNFVLMQFTGLRDKNGREICEGDIVKFRNNSLYDRKNKIGVVVWNEREAMWEAKSSKEKVKERDIDWQLDRITSRFLYNGQIEIIGNIFENPELLAQS